VRGGIADGPPDVELGAAVGAWDGGAPEGVDGDAPDPEHAAKTMALSVTTTMRERADT
jgi:hypothetical protein